jgi:hypothetical protein
VLAVQCLEKAGVVLFGKTNVQLMLADHPSFHRQRDLRLRSGASLSNCRRKAAERCMSRAPLPRSLGQGRTSGA